MIYLFKDRQWKFDVLKAEEDRKPIELVYGVDYTELDIILAL